MTKIKLTKNDWFCVCDQCGSIEWVEKDEEYGYDIVNTLENDGTISRPHLKSIDSEEYNFKINPTCSICENDLKRLSIKHVPIETRRKIAKMSDEDRITWVAGYLIVDKFEDARLKEGKEDEE